VAVLGVALVVLSFVYAKGFFEPLRPTISGDVRGGEELQPVVQAGHLQLEFHPVGQAGPPTRTLVGRDGSYSVKLRPGRYKVGVSVALLGDGGEMLDAVPVLLAHDVCHSRQELEVDLWPCQQYSIELSKALRDNKGR
jgi:hypothetical protein